MSSEARDTRDSELSELDLGEAESLTLPGGVEVRAPETDAAATQRPEMNHDLVRKKASSDKIREMFDLLDVDGGGTLDKNEVKQLAKKLGAQLKPKDLHGAFSRMDRRRVGEVNFDDFVHWWKYKQEEDRRALRLKARELFDAVDDDRSGFLDKEEAQELATKIRKKCKVELDPPFDLERDFKMMDVEGLGEVSYAEFESWLRKRTGDEDADIPVLPESMVRRITEMSNQIDTDGGMGAVTMLASTAVPSKVKTTKAKVLWGFLRPRLKLLVRMKRQWGDIKDLYASSSATSLFEPKPLPPYIRSPDTTFGVVWDLVQIVALLYVSIMVPLRAGFTVEVPTKSAAFVVDLVVDVYFITDLLLNFRTAFWRGDGMLETKSNEIAKNYLKGWFSIDFLSCVPVQYIAIIAGDDGTGGGNSAGANMKAFKALRLLRLAKLLRLARIKRILEKYEDVFDVQPFLGLIFTLFSIFFAAHILACFWFMVGNSCESINGVDEVCGWVTNDDGQGSGRPWSAEDLSMNRIGLGVQYITSMYTILKSEFAFTDVEFTFSVFSELVVGFVYGALAGVMATMMQGAKAGEQEYMQKLASLKAWMKARDLKKHDANKILAFYRARAKGTCTFDEAEILQDMPPSLSGDITQYLYSRFIKQLPMFRSLGKEVMTYLCGRVTPLSAIKEQIIMQEGQVGSELYFIIEGEVEVLSGGERLGFLGEGSFFGESPVIETMFGRRGNGAEIRTRTVRATSGEVSLGFISKADIEEVLEQFPELEFKLKQFSKSGSALSSKKKEEMAELKRKGQRRDKEKAAAAGAPADANAQPTTASILEVIDARHEQRSVQMNALVSSIQGLQHAMDIDRRDFAEGLRGLARPKVAEPKPPQGAPGATGRPSR